MQAELIEFVDRPPEGGKGRPAKVFKVKDQKAVENKQPGTSSPSTPSEDDGLNGSF